MADEGSDNLMLDGSTPLPLIVLWDLVRSERSTYTAKEDKNIESRTFHVTVSQSLNILRPEQSR